jgi:hypothetical protein
MAAFFAWMISKNVRTVFAKITFQKTLEGDLYEMPNSLLVHSQKHPEVLQVIGYNPEDLVLLGPRALAKEYIRGIKFLLKKSIKTLSRGDNSRRSYEFTYKGELWLIVLEQSYRNLGTQNNYCLVPVGDLTIITCYRKSRGGTYYSYDKDFLLALEYNRLSNILYWGSDIQLIHKNEDLMNEFIVITIIGYNDWEQQIDNIFEDILNEILNSLELEFHLKINELLPIPQINILDASNQEENSWGGEGW